MIDIHVSNPSLSLRLMPNKQITIAGSVLVKGIGRIINVANSMRLIASGGLNCLD